MGTTILKGYSLEKAQLPPRLPDAVVSLKGSFGGRKAEFSLNNDTLSKHMMLVGGTGCGKSNLFYTIVNQLQKQMTTNDVMIIFDSKGDFASKFYSAGDLIIGNSKNYRQKSEKWNIFKEIIADGTDDSEVQLNAQEICKALFDERTKGNSSNPFFPNAARDLLAAILIVFIRMGMADREFAKENLYNDKLREHLDSFSSNDIYDLLHDVSDMQSVLSYVGDNEQGQGVMSELYSVIRDVLIGIFSDKGSFSIRKFVRNKGGKKLFIEYDLAIGSVLTPMYKLLFDLALKEAMGRTKSEGNVYLICDEFKLLPNLQHIDDAVNFGRSLGVKVFAGIQSIEQLYEIYGQSRGKNLAAGFSSIIAFRANDVTTREYISSLYGKNIILEQYRKMDSSVVEEKRIGATVEDWDLNSLKIGEAIVGLPFDKPFRFQFEKYSHN